MHTKNSQHDQSDTENSARANGDAPATDVATGDRPTLSRRKKVVWAMVIIVLPFALLELGLRLTVPCIAWPSARFVWDNGEDRQTDKSEWPTTYPKNASGVHRYMEFAVPVRFNSDGFRDEEFDPAAGPVVILLGDSTTMGHGVAYDETFAVLTERALRGHFDDLQVWNVGRSGSGPVVQIRLLERMLAKYPTARVEAVVLVSGVSVQNGAGNDLTDMERNFAYLHGGRPGASAPKAFRPQYVLRQSAVLHGAEVLVSRWRRENLKLSRLNNWDELWRQYYRCLDRLRSICARRDTALIVGYLTGRMTEDAADIEDVTQRMRSYLDPHGIAFVRCALKTAPELAGQLWYYPIDGHINAVAHRYCANQLTPIIADVLAKQSGSSR